MLDLTPEQYLSKVNIPLFALIDASLVGGASILMKLGASLRPLLGVEPALFWASQVTAALSALRSWKVTNEYATIQPTRALLASYTPGAQLVMEAHVSLYVVRLLMEVFEGQHSKPNAD